MAFFCRTRPLGPFRLWTLLPFLTALFDPVRCSLFRPSHPDLDGRRRPSRSGLSPGRSLPPILLEVTKLSRAPYAHGEWPVPSTVLRLPLPGGYLIRVRKLSTGGLPLSKSVRVILPTSFPGNSFLLLTALALAGFLSGWRVKRSLAGSGNFCGERARGGVGRPGSRGFRAPSGAELPGQPRRWRLQGGRQRSGGLRGTRTDRIPLPGP